MATTGAPAKKYSSAPFPSTKYLLTILSAQRCISTKYSTSILSLGSIPKPAKIRQGRERKKHIHSYHLGYPALVESKQKPFMFHVNCFGFIHKLVSSVSQPWILCFFQIRLRWVWRFQNVGKFLLATESTRPLFIKTSLTPAIHSSSRRSGKVDNSCFLELFSFSLK